MKKLLAIVFILCAMKAHATEPMIFTPQVLSELDLGGWSNPDEDYWDSRNYGQLYLTLAPEITQQLTLNVDSSWACHEFQSETVMGVVCVKKEDK